MNNCNISGPENEFQLHAASQHITWMFLMFMYVLLKQSKGTRKVYTQVNDQCYMLNQLLILKNKQKQKEQKKSF